MATDPEHSDEPSWLDQDSPLELGLPENASATVTFLPGGDASATASAGDPNATVDVGRAEPDPEATADVDETTDCDPNSTVSRGQPSEEQIPEHIGRYEILDKLGEGGMGWVYLAKESYLRRRVALKRIKGQKTESTARFVTEAQITAQLDHPGIIPVYSLEIADDGSVAYTMKPVEGLTLAERIERARAHFAQAGERDAWLSSDLDDLLDVFVRVCEALQFAHSRGVIHRDLKPENIMIGAHREVHVMDWGLAKPTGKGADDASESVDLEQLPDLPAARRTRQGAIKGTPLYMAPEQAQGRPDQLTPAADVYALGVILHELVYLSSYRSAETLVEAVKAARENLRTPPPEALDDSVELDAIVSLATRLAPGERYPSAQALGEDVRRVLLGDETRALPDRGWRRVRRWISHHPSVALLLGVAGATTFVLTLGLGLQRQRVKEAEARLQAARESRAMGELVARVGEKTRAVALHFQRLGGRTAGIAARTREVLADGEPDPDAPALVSPEVFRSSAGAPAGSARSAGYGDRLVNPRRAVGATRPGPAGEHDLRLLASLVGELRACFSGRELPLARPEELDRAIVAHEAPIEWSYVALDRSGTIALFPGSTSAWDASYDPRQRSWYREAKEAYVREGRVESWSRPYHDLMGQGIVLTATQAILDDEGEFLGVAAIDLTFGAVVDRLLTFADVPGFERALVVDRRGDVLLATDRSVQVDAAGEIQAKPHPEPAVVAAIQAGRSSLHASPQPGGGTRLTVWTLFPRLGWAIVVEVDKEQLVAGIGAD